MQFRAVYSEVLLYDIFVKMVYISTIRMKFNLNLIYMRFLIREYGQEEYVMINKPTCMLIIVQRIAYLNKIFFEHYLLKGYLLFHL